MARPVGLARPRQHNIERITMDHTVKTYLLVEIAVMMMIIKRRHD